MKEKRCLIVLAVDNSGSMYSIEEEMESLIRNFIKKLKEDPEECYVSYYPFDNDVIQKFEREFVEVKNVGKLSMVPNGATSLYDSFHKIINKVGDKLKGMNEENRPEKVILIFITDGSENSSSNYTSNDIMGLISQQEQVYNWKFIYTGANQDSFMEGKKMGFRHENISNFEPSKEGIEQMLFFITNKVDEYRKMPYYDYTKS